MHGALCVVLLILALHVTAQQEAAAPIISLPIDGRHCGLESDPGPCNAAFVKWYFNSSTKKCEQFTYGGCGGNANRFETQADCDAACIPVQDICSLPMDSGPCEAAISRWFFSPSTGTCRPFIYGGCQGNANNFETLADCQRVCREDCIFVDCLVDPCQMSECPAFPDALCISNFCTGCNADFFMDGEIVDCEIKPTVCLTEEDPCQNPATAIENNDTTTTTFTPCCEDLTCCVCGPPVLTEDFTPSPFGVCRPICFCPIG